jgi:hypothetical protein
MSVGGLDETQSSRAQEAFIMIERTRPALGSSLSVKLPEASPILEKGTYSVGEAGIVSYL